MICIDLKTNKTADVCPDRRFVVALGNFDGVHIAHQKLIRLARSLRDETCPDASVAAWFFSTLPETSLPVPQVPALTSPEQKLTLLAEAGAEYAFLFSFPELRDLSPEAFTERVLKTDCNAVGAVCGYNFRYGKNAAGTPAELNESFPGCFAVLPEVKLNGETVSSTRIRGLIENGDTEQAAAMLGHPFAVSYPVAHGKHLGTKLGIPTINQYFPTDGSAVIPHFGVYATETVIDGRSYFGVSNVGVRPTVEYTDAVNCETNLFDCRGELYGKTAEVKFHRFLRPETRFSSVEELRTAIEADIGTAKVYFEARNT